MKPWIYNGQEFIADKSIFGFTYHIVFYNREDCSYWDYYGKKQTLSIVELDALKNGNTRPDHIKFVGRNKNGKRVQREVVGKVSKYDKYIGSCKHEDMDKMDVVSREVIRVIPYGDNCKINLTYAELELLVNENVLRRDDCLNANILNKFHSGRIV